MITTHQLEVRAGARLLMENVSFRVAAGDKVGLVGRNGAGKTTLTKILAGEALPASGTVQTTGEVGYLPQDPRIGDPEVLARDRILSARGLDDAVRRLRQAEAEMASDDVKVRERAMRRYERADAELHAGGGYAAESEAAIIASSLGIEERILTQRETDERRRKRERANAESKAKTLTDQANRMRAKASKASAAQSMLKRAEKMMAGVEGERQADKVARIKFPAPAPCGKTPITAAELSKSYGSLEVFTDVDLAIDKGSRVVILGLNGAGKTTMLRILAGVDQPDTGRVVPGHGLKIGYYAQEHETLDVERTVLENMQSAAPQLTDTEARSVLGSFLFSGEDAHKPAKVLSGGEKTRLALASLVVSSANVLLLDEPTNNLDPASREEVLAAIRTYEGAIVLVTHDEGAVRALEPDRVLLLPDGDEDLWSDDYADLVSLA